MRTAKALVDGGFAAAGYTNVNIDSCWTNTNRGPNGELMANTIRFPRGMKPIADELHAMVISPQGFQHEKIRINRGTPLISSSFLLKFSIVWK